jgi:glycosyltransferase involved in cell wall biosynthesis
MKRPLICVIVTAYNRREFTKDAIKSFNNSTLPEGEYELRVSSTSAVALE